MKVRIQDIKAGLVRGVQVATDIPVTSYDEYFEFTMNPLSLNMDTNQVVGGIIISHQKECCFSIAENHIDNEMFFFLSGTGLMMFIDYDEEGEPDVRTAQIVRIRPGTILTIEKGKGHFVCIAEGEEPVISVVCAPMFEAPKKRLSEPVIGIY